MTDIPHPAGAPFASDEVAAWHGFLTAHAKLTRRLDALIRQEHGLSLVQFDVLINLRIAGGELRMSDLADRLLLSRTGLVRLIDGLVAREWLVRVPDPTDARGKLAVLTSDGAAKVTAAGASHRANVRRHFLELVDDEQRAALAGIWNAVSASLDAAGPGPAISRSSTSAVHRRRGRAA